MQHGFNPQGPIEIRSAKDFSILGVLRLSQPHGDMWLSLGVLPSFPIMALDDAKKVSKISPAEKVDLKLDVIRFRKGGEMFEHRFTIVNEREYATLLKIDAFSPLVEVEPLSQQE